MDTEGIDCIGASCVHGFSKKTGMNSECPDVHGIVRMCGVQLLVLFGRAVRSGLEKYGSGRVVFQFYEASWGMAVTACRFSSGSILTEYATFSARSGVSCVLSWMRSACAGMRSTVVFPGRGSVLFRHSGYALLDRARVELSIPGCVVVRSEHLRRFGVSHFFHDYLEDASRCVFSLPDSRSLDVASFSALNSAAAVCFAMAVLPGNILSPRRCVGCLPCVRAFSPQPVSFFNAAG